MKKPGITEVTVVAFALGVLGFCLNFAYKAAQRHEAAEAKMLAAGQSKALTEAEQKAWDDAKQEEAEKKFMAARNLAYIKCRDEGNKPIMTFGFRLICLRKEAVAWEQEIE